MNHLSLALRNTHLQQTNKATMVIQTESASAAQPSIFGLLQSDRNQTNTILTRNNNQLRTSAPASLRTSLRQSSSPLVQQNIRRDMVGRIEMMLSQTNQHHDEFPVGKLAKVLEQHLYKTAPSFREYADLNSLKSRIRLVTVSLLRRRLKKRQQPTRDESLQQVLGVDRFNQVKNLVCEVKMLRLERLASECSSSFCCRQKRRDYTTLSSKSQETISWPLRCLFFKTTLVEAFESAPVNRIAELNWDAMMEEARLNIQSYNGMDQDTNRPESISVQDERSNYDIRPEAV